MKFKSLVFVTILIIACGPSDEEIQDQINAAVESALETTSTSILNSTTTISETTNTETYVENLIYKETINKKGFYFLIDGFSYTTIQDDVMLKINGEWNDAETIQIVFRDNCTLFKRLNSNKSVGLVLFQDEKNCSDVSTINYIQIQSSSNESSKVKYLTIKNDSYFYIGEERNYLSGTKFKCCYELNFNELDDYILELNKIKNNLSSTETSSTTSSTSTTSTSTTTSSSTSTTSTSTTTTIYRDTEAPTWTDKSISIANVNPTYFEVLWQPATDNINVAGYKFYLNNELKGEYIRNNDNNSIFLNGLLSNTTYNLEIIAYDDAGNLSNNNPSTTVTTSGSTQNNTTTTTQAPFVCEGNEQNDSQPPVLVSSNIDKTTVDVSQNSVVVTITMNITDNCVGVATGFDGPTVSVDSIGFASTGRTSGDNKNGTWTATITIPQGQSNGNYKVSLFPLEDNNGNSGMFATLGYIQVDW